MAADDISKSWASRFGLVSSPLFGAPELVPDGSHHVLLDGGLGSFALSVSPQQIWKERVCADWSWSCDLPHHVTITDNEVAVVRWDKANPELFTRDSVERQLSTFYSYLASDRVESNKRVVEFMLNIYRSIRSLVANTSLADERSIDAFLAFLSSAIQRTSGPNIPVPGLGIGQIKDENEDLLRSLPRNALEALFAEVSDRRTSDLSLTLMPSLAIRHAGSEIFQEAHFELLRAPAPDLFGHVGHAELKPTARGAAHFTPPALARTIVEQTLAQVSDLRSCQRLRILDPACGSGAFLHEALRALQREKFVGHVSLVGRDTSRAAVSMAKFVLENAVADWVPAGGCALQIEVGDSLTARLPVADVVLMNPPFISWTALTSQQRSHMEEVLGRQLPGRGDYSMAFVTRALEALRLGGALGTLLPGSLLTLQAANDWRESILDQADLRFIASLGDYSLFRYAQVQVSSIVLTKRGNDAGGSDTVTALVTGNHPEATGTALRKLRRNKATGFKELSDDGWHLFEDTTRRFRDRPTWRLIVPSTELALNQLAESGRVAPVGDLFAVRQGVRTGMNSVFVLTTAQLKALDESEKRWFRQASINDSIHDGTIRTGHYIFYPYNEDGLAITDEEQLTDELPTYFQHYLQPNRSRLLERASIVRSKRSDWWGLSERRTWALDPSPRIASKYFGGPGSFAMDFDASYIIVQGFAWMPKWASVSDEEQSEALTFTLGSREILSAYSAIFNSDTFVSLLRIYSQHVAGGQYDLSWRFVRHVPIPNVSGLMADERTSDVVLALAEIGQRDGVAEPLRRQRAERLVAELYGSDFVHRI